METRTCEYCGKEYTPCNYRQRFCTPKCKADYWNKSKPDRHKPDYYKRRAEEKKAVKEQEVKPEIITDYIPNVLEGGKTAELVLNPETKKVEIKEDTKELEVSKRPTSLENFICKDCKYCVMTIGGDNSNKYSCKAFQQIMLIQNNKREIMLDRSTPNCVYFERKR